MNKNNYAPSGEIRIQNVRSRAYQELSKRQGITMNRILRKKLVEVLDEYPDDIPVNPTSPYEIFISGLSPKRIQKLNAICANLGVSVSDFMKVKLYDDNLKALKKK